MHISFEFQPSSTTTTSTLTITTSNSTSKLLESPLVLKKFQINTPPYLQITIVKDYIPVTMKFDMLNDSFFFDSEILPPVFHPLKYPSAPSTVSESFFKSEP